VLPVDNEASVTLPNSEDDAAVDAEDAEAYAVTASARGVPLDAVDAREVKAVTFSQMVVEERDDAWYAYVVFDV
jgi:SHS2 domain-containing protein